MTNEEILKKFKKIEKDVSSNLPNIWIRFSVPKKQVENIPDDADVTPRKIFLYNEDVGVGICATFGCLGVVCSEA